MWGHPKSGDTCHAGNGTDLPLPRHEDPERKWELHDGELREKPDMSAEHNDAMFYLGILLQQQLDRSQFRLRVNAGRVRRIEKTWYIPDVTVIPTELELAQRGKPGSLEVYNDPLPLVIEIWSPSTGDYDVNTKLPDYQQRGDLEIWRLHLYERTLTVWRRQPNGSYVEESLPRRYRPAGGPPRR